MKPIYFTLIVLLCSCHINKKTSENQSGGIYKAGGCIVYPERVYSVMLDTVQLDSIEIVHPEMEFYNIGEEKFVIIPNETGDLVRVLEDDTQVTRFHVKDNYIIDKKLEVYYPNGQLSYSYELADSTSNGNIRRHYRYFKSVRHGKHLSYWPNGNLSGIVYYKHGLNDSFEKRYYKDGKQLYYYMHRDTQLYFYEDGKVQSLSRYVNLGRTKRYKVLKYWPNGN